MDDLPVGQHKDLLPGARDALHIHNKNTVGGKHGLVTHRLVGSHDLLAVQQQLLHIFADLFLFDADEVLHRFIPKFHSVFPFQRCSAVHSVPSIASVAWCCKMSGSRFWARDML